MYPKYSISLYVLYFIVLQEQSYVLSYISSSEYYLHDLARPEPEARKIPVATEGHSEPGKAKEAKVSVVL